MHIHTNRNIAREIYLLSHEELESYLSTILGDESEAPHALAELMLRFMDAIDESRGRPVSALHSLKDGIEILYLETTAHDLAFDLYLAWLRGQLKPQDEPMTLIKEAMARRAGKSSARRERHSEKTKPGTNNAVKITDKAAAKRAKKPANRKSSQRKNQPPASPGSTSHRKTPGEATGTGLSATGSASK